MIFLSYRTEDTNMIVDVLERDLQKEFGQNAIFRDRTRITAGQAWSTEIKDKAQSCAVMLAIIGDKWASLRHKDGPLRSRSRLEDPEDWPRKEIQIALAAGRPVMPVLVNRAKQPAKRLLVATGLERLFAIQAAQLRTDSFELDLRVLIDALYTLSPGLGPNLATFHADAAHTHDVAMADPKLARKRYGQALTPLLVDTHGQAGGYWIERRAAFEALEECFSKRHGWLSGRSQSPGQVPPPIIILGEEGVGKSWLAATWCRRAHPERVLLFVPSVAVRNRAKNLIKLFPDYCMDLLRPEAVAQDRDGRWRAWFESDRFREHARDRLLVVVDGINEAPQLHWPEILSELWHEIAPMKGGLIVTCRPSYWRTLRRGVEWPAQEVVRLDGFTRDELEEALARHGRHPDSISSRLKSRLQNPRAFTLAMRLLDDLPPGIDLGIDRLLYHYWDHLGGERPDLESLDARDVRLGLAEQARVFHERRRTEAEQHRTDLAAEDHVFEEQVLRDRFAPRYSVEKPVVDTLIAEIRDGRFFEEVPGGFAQRYVFRSTSLGFALGLYVVRQAERIADQLRTAPAERPALLKEELASLLEPVMDFDQTADQMLAASTVVCLGEYPQLLRTAILDAFIELRNRPEVLRAEFEALAIDAPEGFAAVLEASLAFVTPERADDWLIGGLRIAYRAHRRGAIEAMHDWIASPSPMAAPRMHKPDASPVADRIMAAKRRATAARIVAGLDLTPLARTFLDWALAVVLEETFDGNATLKSPLASRPHELSPIVHLIRCDDCAPQLLRRSILDALDGPPGIGIADVHSVRAQAFLCTVLATPEALDRAESILRGATKVLNPRIRSVSIQLLVLRAPQTRGRPRNPSRSLPRWRQTSPTRRAGHPMNCHRWSRTSLPAATRKRSRRLAT
ncbi:MAG TPA: TIR domain-containing protein [Kofleriaceae bacterium]